MNVSSHRTLLAVSLFSKCILNIYINLFHHRKCNSYHIFPKSLTEAVPPVLPPVLDHLILGGQHGAVADGELPEPLPLPHLRRVVAEHKLKWLNFSF